MNASERSEMDIRKFINYYTYSEAKVSLPLILGIIQAMKQNSSESSKQYRARIEGTVKVIIRLGLEIPTQQLAMRYYKPLNLATHEEILADLQNAE